MARPQDTRLIGHHCFLLVAIFFLEKKLNMTEIKMPSYSYLFFVFVVCLFICLFIFVLFRFFFGGGCFVVLEDRVIYLFIYLFIFDKFESEGFSENKNDIYRNFFLFFFSVFFVKTRTFLTLG